MEFDKTIESFINEELESGFSIVAKAVEDNSKYEISSEENSSEVNFSGDDLLLI